MDPDGVPPPPTSAEWQDSPSQPSESMSGVENGQAYEEPTYDSDEPEVVSVNLNRNPPKPKRSLRPTAKRAANTQPQPSKRRAVAATTSANSALPSIDTLVFQPQATPTSAHNNAGPSNPTGTSNAAGRSQLLSTTHRALLPRSTFYVVTSGETLGIYFTLVEAGRAVGIRGEIKVVEDIADANRTLLDAFRARALIVIDEDGEGHVFE